MKYTFSNKSRIILFALMVFLFQLAEAYGDVVGKVLIDVRENDQDIIYYGADIFDGMSYPMIVSDINGDGLNDLIVAATASDGLEPEQINRGVVYVLFGKESLPIKDHISVIADIKIYGEEHGINGMEGDEVGYALASTDLNQDGINDIIVSSVYADGPDNLRPDCGEVYVIYGRAVYPNAMYLAGDADITIYGADGGIIEGSADSSNPDKGDMTGYALATGDFNNDGFQDIVMSGVLGDGPDNKRIHSGDTYIVWGASQLPAVIDLRDSDAVTRIWGPEVGDFAGFALFAKDINGDQIDDIMIGALLGDGPDNSRNDSGEIYILYGSGAFPLTIELGTDADVTIYGAEAGDQRFNPVNYFAAADFNGDSLTDLIIGAPFADGDGNGNVESGEAYIILGKASPVAIIDLSTDFDSILYGTDNYDHFGFSVAVGDVNGDNLDDILISAVDAASVYDIRTSAGEVYVFYGRADIPPVMNVSDADVEVFGADPWDFMGVTLHIGDISNDGTDDILIGAPIGDGIDNGVEDSGELIIVFGDSNGIGLNTIAPFDNEVVACQSPFSWTPGRPSNNIWAFQIFESPDETWLLHTSPFLLEPTYTLPDNFLAEIPANKRLYWKVFGANPNETPLRIQKSKLFSFTREGLHLLTPGDAAELTSAPTLTWTSGCSGNSSWIVVVSDDSDFTRFLALSSYLDGTSLSISSTVWDTFPAGRPLYWKVLGFYQPDPWRVHMDWSQEDWTFIKSH